MAGTHILAIDQGTTSSRAIVFDAEQRIVGVGQEEFTQHFPQPGWVEHDANEIWQTVERTIASALRKARIGAGDIAAIGITNQRETVVVWDKKTGEPIHRAIVWQDRRTADTTRALKEAGHEALVTGRTGLLLDPYFSGSKIGWLLDHVEGARDRAEAGELAFGTIDSWLIWKLTGGARHVTDATNACRTLLFNIDTQDWDDELLALFRVSRAMLPEVLDCAAEFGTARIDGVDLPILGVAGDQHAAVIGNACFDPGMVKSTYGTGCFAVLNTGEVRVPSSNRMLTTLCYRLDGVVTYGLEGSIFVAGAAVQWLRDELGIVDRAEQSGELAGRADPAQPVYLVPAFTGLGAPYWDAEARGAIYGLTRGTGRAEIARAALESVCYQTRDLIEAMRADYEDAGNSTLRVDGGMVASDWTMQALADQLGAPVDRPVVMETTALGAAWLAGHKAGVWPDMAGFAERWRVERRFEPQMEADERARRYEGWRDAVARTLTR